MEGDTKVANSGVRFLRRRGRKSVFLEKKGPVPPVYDLFGKGALRVSRGDKLSTDSWYVGAVLFLGVLYIYFSTMTPTCPPGDSGKLLVVANRAGVAHPPGYPLFTLLNYMAIHFVPDGLVRGIDFMFHFGWSAHSDDLVASKVAMVTCVFGAGSAAVIHLATAQWCGFSVGGLFAGVLFAFNSYVWRYSIQGDVFALNNFLVAVLVFLAVQINHACNEAERDLRLRSKDAVFTLSDASVKKWRQYLIWLWCLSAFCSGLAFANQQTSIVYVIPLAIWSVYRVYFGGRLNVMEDCDSTKQGAQNKRKIKNEKNNHRQPFKTLAKSSHLGRFSLWGVAWFHFFYVVLSFLVGISPYAWLFMRSRIGHTVYSWGNMYGFWRHVTRAEFGSLQLYSGGDGASGLVAFVERFLLFLSTFHRDTWNIGFPLVLLGVLVFWQNRFSNTLLFTCVTAFCLYSGVIFYLSNLPVNVALLRGTLVRFFPQATLLLCVFTGLGFSLIYQLSVDLVSVLVDYALGAASGGGDHNANGSKDANASASTRDGDLSPHRRRGGDIRGKQKRIQLIKIILALVYGLFSIALGLGMMNNLWEEMDHSEYHQTETYGKILLDSVGPGALFLTLGNMCTNAVMYVHHVKGYRPDVEVLDVEAMSQSWWGETQISHYPKVVFPRSKSFYDPHRERGFSLKELLDANLPLRDVYLVGSWPAEDKSIEGVYDLLPMGYVQRVMRVRDLVYDPKVITVEATANVSAFVWNRWLKDMNERVLPLNTDDLSWLGKTRLTVGVDSWYAVLYSAYFQRYHYFANFLLNVALLMDANDPVLSHVRLRFLDRAVATYGFISENCDIRILGPDPSMYFNMGIAYEHIRAIQKQQGDLAKERDAIVNMVAAWNEAVQLGGPADKELLSQIREPLAFWKEYITENINK